MSSTHLKKITTLAKKMRKSRPKKHRKWTEYVKDAAAKLKKKPKAKRKSSAPKRIKKRVVRKRATRKKVVRAVARVRSRKVTKRRKVVVHRVRRVGSHRSGKTNFLIPALLLGGAALIGWQLLKPKTPDPKTQVQQQYPSIRYTGNEQRDNTSANIVMWATAAGMAFDLIKQLIDKMNSSSDADVEKLKNDINDTGGIPDWIMYG